MNNNKIDYGIITAVNHEKLPYLPHCTNLESLKIDTVEYTIATLENKRVALVSAGWGTVCAASVMTHLIKSFSPKGIIFSGTAGALNAELNLGDVIVGESAFEIEMYNLINACKGTPYEQDLMHSFKHEIQPIVYHADAELLNVARLIIPHFSKAYSGRLATSSTFPINPEHYPLLVEQKIMALNMEDSAIYQTSWLLGTPSLCVRGISNLIQAAGKNANLGVANVELASSNAAEMVRLILRKLN